VKFKSLMSQIGKPLNTSEALANRTSKWIAERFGISRRQAQRYKSGAAPLDRPQDRAKRERAMESADADTRRAVAAKALREAQAAHAGRVPVVDKSPKGKAKPPGRNFRNVGTVPLTDEKSRRRMTEAAEALEAGDIARAEKAMSEAITRTPGKDYGEALDIADWPPDFHLI
jgi:hypothetical protein